MTPGPGLRRVSRLTPAAVVALAASVPLILRVLLLPVFPPPVPTIADEFCHLLAADTFASGRLVNPPLPFPDAFETFYVLQRPTYASMHPAGQGLVLAAGKVLAGSPWAGVLGSVGLMCAAVAWLLLAWVPPRWALPGSLAFGLIYGVEHYWMNSYWGGAAAATGGALWLGAASRIVRGDRGGVSPAMTGLMLGLGAGILIHTRPWEGAFLCLGTLLGFALIARPGLRERLRRRLAGAAPAAATVIGGALLLLGLWTWRVTGQAFLHPRNLYQKTFVAAPALVWQDPSVPTGSFRAPNLRRYLGEWQKNSQSWGGAEASVPAWLGFAVWLKNFKILDVSVAAALLLLAASRGEGPRLVVVTFATFFAGVSLQNFRQMHYLAPAFGLFALLVVLALRTLSCGLLRRHAFGRALPALLVAAAAAGLVRNMVLTGRGEPDAFGSRRESVVRRLENLPGGHLVFVRYAPGWDNDRDWIVNGADIRGAKIVFARQLTDPEDARLTEWLGPRTIWRLEAGPGPGDTTLVPGVAEPSRARANGN